MTKFDADSRANERESGPIVIDGRTFHPRRLTNARLRQVRKLSRDAAREQRRASEESEDYAETYREAIADGLTEDEAKLEARAAGDGCDAASDISNRSLAQQLNLLLVDDGMQEVGEDVFHDIVENKLDQRDIGPLMKMLVGSDDTDPTTSS